MNILHDEYNPLGQKLKLTEAQTEIVSMAG